METEQHICKNCVMDRSASEITFNDGVCNFCTQAQGALKEIDAEKHKLPEIINRIKKDGQGKTYDCILGLSGGADSATALHHAVRLGLRPLCFSVDNGWNDPKADENIMRLVEGLKVPFYRYTINLERFKELQAAFIKAGVPNIEIPTDHVLMSATYEMATKHGIKWIISGGNVATESIMPPSWGYSARDLTHIKDVYYKMMGKKLTGLPLCGLLKWNIYRWWYGTKTLYPLDYLSYNREEAIKLLEEKYLYKNYHEKHCENLFTWWFQNYFLFEKFGYDKRKAHLSSLINSGQIDRRTAMSSLADRPVYPKLGLEGKIFKYQKHSHYDYKTDEWLYNLIGKVVKTMKWNF